jgi:hypothetical protein
MAQQARTDIGFHGGQILALRTQADVYEKLMKALGDDKSGRWHAVDTGDEVVQIDLSRVVYVRRETGDQKVGF